MSPAAGLTAGEAARKSLHIGAGLLALLLPWLTRWPAVGICLAAIASNALLLPRLTGRRMERAEDRARGYAAGIILYPLAVGLLLLLFGSRMEVVAASWGILAFGDGFATIAGRGLGGPSLPWNRSKTVSGLAAFFLAGGAAATGLFSWVSSEPVSPRSLVLCLSAALLGALLETIPTGIDDNLAVPLMTGGFLFALTRVEPALLAGAAPTLWGNLAPALAVNFAVAALALAARAVNLSGAVAGLIIGGVVFTFGGWQAYTLLILFFVLGSGATKVGYRQKAARRIAQEQGGRRGARHAVANCGLPAFLAFLAMATPLNDFFLIAFAAALATAAFDTVSSEIGQVYGRHPFLITSFRPVPPGTEGAVSVEGTLAGLAAAVLLAVSGVGLELTGQAAWTGAWIVVASAFVGTTVESILGATLETARMIDNEAMNFTNTLVGALTALGLCAAVLS